MTVSNNTHSPIGASSYYRFSKCPGSVKLSEGITSLPSKYADEGTKAHEIAAFWLEGKDIRCLDAQDEMLENVKIYVEAIEKEKATDLDGVLLVEHYFDLSFLHPNARGTADAVIYLPNAEKLIVADLKYGAGLSVEVENNGQLLYYALGALLTTDFKVSEVELMVIQPRCDHPDGVIRRWAFDVTEILEFKSDLEAAIKRTEEKNAPLIPGSHCRFCPASGICTALKDRALTAIENAFSKEVSYDPNKLSEVLSKLDQVENWVESVRAFAYSEAKQGRIPPGYKLVAKRATRKWKNEKQITSFLQKDLGYDSGIFDIKLKSVAQMEKILHKNDKEKISEYVEAISSGDTLVSDSDPREAIKALLVSDMFEDETKTNKSNGEK